MKTRVTIVLFGCLLAIMPLLAQSSTQPYATLTRSEASNYRWLIGVVAKKGTATRPWVDVNNNGICDEGETIVSDGVEVPFESCNKQLNVYGELESLFCYENKLIGLDVSQLNDLTFLSAGTNQLTQIDLSKNKKLSKLYLQQNRLTKLDLSKNPELTMCFVYSNNLTELDLSKQQQLNQLDCNNNAINKLHLPEVPTMVRFDCNNNRLTSLPVQQLSSLWHLQCAGNLLTELDLSAMPELSYLYCQANKLTALDISKTPELEVLYAQENELTHITIQGNEWLQKIMVAYNKLETIDLTSCTDLVEASLEGNPITDVDFTQNKSLRWVNLRNMMLPDVNFSAQEGLETLLLAGNRLKELNVSHPKNLKVIEIYGNSIRHGAMDKLIALLPDAHNAVKPGQFFFDIKGKQNGNVLTKKQVEQLEKKNWFAYMQEATTNRVHEFKGYDLYSVILKTEGEGEAKLVGYDELNAVPSGFLLSVEATPSAGYKLGTITCNNLPLQPDESFEVNGNTIVEVSFIKIESNTSVKQQTYAIYPSRAQQTLYLILGEQRPYHVTIYTPMGAIVWSGKVNGENATLDISSLQHGEYILSIDGLGCKPFVI